MTENVETAIFEILKRIQKDIADQRAETAARLERLEETTRKQRRNIAGMLVVGKTMAGVFVERFEAVERRLDGMDQRLERLEIARH